MPRALPIKRTCLDWIRGISVRSFAWAKNNYIHNSTDLFIYILLLFSYFASICLLHISSHLLTYFLFLPTFALIKLALHDERGHHQGNIVVSTGFEESQYDPVLPPRIITSTKLLFYQYSFFNSLIPFLYLFIVSILGLKLHSFVYYISSLF